MNNRIKELIEQAYVMIDFEHSSPLKTFNKEKFADLLLDEICFELLMMDAKTQGQHNYYKHAAIELKRKFKSV